MRSPLIEKLQVAEEELARRIRETNVGRFFGFALEAAEPGRAVLVLRVKPHHRQVHGVVHGGVMAALADTAGGMATYMTVPRGARVATVEMKINFLEAVEKGTVVAEARVQRFHFAGVGVVGAHLKNPLAHLFSSLDVVPAVTDQAGNSDAGHKGDAFARLHGSFSYVKESA